MSNFRTEPNPRSTLDDQPLTHRQQLRLQLRTAHLAWCQDPRAAQQQQALTAHLALLLDTLEPDCLGVYWPLSGEFDPRPAAGQALTSGVQLALPWAFKAGPHEASAPRMVFRQWEGQPPSSQDECGIPSPTTRDVVPDVLLVPCVGITRNGWRLGYGKGYYDRYLAAHPHITPIGVAWSHALLTDDALQPQPHDQAMMLVVTPEGVLSAE